MLFFSVANCSIILKPPWLLTFPDLKILVSWKPLLKMWEAKEVPERKMECILIYQTFTQTHWSPCNNINTRTPYLSHTNFTEILLLFEINFESKFSYQNESELSEKYLGKKVLDGANQSFLLQFLWRSYVDHTQHV